MIRRNLPLACGPMALGCVLMVIGFCLDIRPLYISGALAFLSGLALEFMLCRCPLCLRRVPLYAPHKFCPYCGSPPDKSKE